MRETTIVNVKGADLPEEWQERAGISGTERVDVVIRTAHAAASRELAGIAARASASARRKGLTPAKLDRLLKEAKAARRR